MGDYDFLDAYENSFDREAKGREKVFDEPLANDPLTLVEDSIEQARPPLGPPVSQVKGYYMPSAPAVPPDPALTGRVDGHRLYNPMRQVTPDPPNPYPPERSYPWREPPIARPRMGGSGSGSKAKPDYQPKSKASTPKKEATVFCPKLDEYIPKSACNSSCPEYDPKDPIHGNCKLKKEEADKLSGRKGGKK